MIKNWETVQFENLPKKKKGGGEEKEGMGWAERKNKAPTTEEGAFCDCTGQANWIQPAALWMLSSFTLRILMFEFSCFNNEALCDLENALPPHKTTQNQSSLSAFTATTKIQESFLYAGMRVKFIGSNINRKFYHWTRNVSHTILSIVWGPSSKKDTSF